MDGTDATSETPRDADVSRRRLLSGSAVAAGALFTGAAFALDGLRDAPPAVAQEVAAAVDLIVQRGDVTVSAAATTIDFAAADFELTETPAGEANVSIGPGITRDADIGAISVKEAGAVGDGVADDTLAFAIASYIAGVNRRTLYIPAGTYKMSGAGFQVGSGARIVGQRGAKLLLSANNAQNGRVITIPDGSGDIFIEGLEIDGNRANQVQASLVGIRVGVASHIKITDCNIHDCTSHGIFDVGSSYCELASNWVHDCDDGGIISRSTNGNKFWHVHHNVVENVGNKANQVTWHGIDSRSTDSIIDHNIVHNVGHDAISGYTAPNLRITISHNICWNDPNWRPSDDGGGHGVHTGGSQIKVIGNVVYNWHGAAIFVRSEPNSDPPASAYVEIIGNTVATVNGNRFGVHNPPYSGQGIRVENFVHGMIANNRVSDTNEEGILLRANTGGIRPAGNMTITGNELDDIGLHGISLEGATAVTITGNSVQNAGGEPASAVAHGIRLVGTNTAVQRVAIVGNTIHSSTGDGINASDIGSACQDVTITGNVISNNTGFGIRTLAHANRFCVTGNILTANAGGTISLVGLTNVNANNLV